MFIQHDGFSDLPTSYLKLLFDFASYLYESKKLKRKTALTLFIAINGVSVFVNYKKKLYRSGTLIISYVQKSGFLVVLIDLDTISLYEKKLFYMSCLLPNNKSNLIRSLIRLTYCVLMLYTASYFPFQGLGQERV